MVEIALIVVKDARGSLWTVPVSRIAKMKMKDGKLSVFLENDDMEYTLIEEGKCSVDKSVMKRHFANAVSSVYVG